MMPRRDFTRRRDILKGVGAFAALGLVPAPAIAQSRTRLTVAFLPVLTATPLFVALEDKLFEKAGIDIDPVRQQSQAQLIETLMAGRADIGAPGTSAGLTAITEAQTPNSLRLFGLQGGGNSVNRVTDGLLASPQSTIAGMRDLRGRVLGHLPGATWRTICRHLVRQAGLNPDRDVRLVELAANLQAAALGAGTVDAVVATEPTATILVQQAVARRVMSNVVAGIVSDPFYAGVSVMPAALPRDRQALARRIVGVFDEATQACNQRFDRYREALPRYLPITAQQIGLVEQPYLRGWRDFGPADAKSFQAFVDMLASEGAIRSAQRVRDIFLKESDFGPF